MVPMRSLDSRNHRYGAQDWLLNHYLKNNKKDSKE